jgi:hypothetical protein
MSDTANQEGAMLIAAERARQVADEGWTTAHDDAHANGEILRAAHAYFAVVLNPARAEMIGAVIWPWSPREFKPVADSICNLVKAGALIAAEIDRLKRAANL